MNTNRNLMLKSSILCVGGKFLINEIVYQLDRLNLFFFATDNSGFNHVE